MYTFVCLLIELDVHVLAHLFLLGKVECARFQNDSRVYDFGKGPLLTAHAL